MASRHGEGRVVSLLEGGYNLDNLGRTVHDQHRRSRELGVVLQAGHLLVQGHCQRKVARTEFSTDDRELGRPELTPLGECGGAVELEIVS